MNDGTTSLASADPDTSVVDGLPITDSRLQAWPPHPNTFGMVGQPQVTALLEDLVRYASATGQRFQDRLLVGPPGVGKSTLARAVARRLVSGGCVLLNAADCRQPIELIDTLGDHGLFSEHKDDAHGAIAVEPSVIFIDEVHALSRPMKAWLLSAMDDERCASADGSLYSFKRVTFLLATTDPGRLSAAFQSRCEPLYLRAYTLDELAGIVWLHARSLLEGAELGRDACLEIASRMRGNPRRAVRALSNALIPHAFAQMGAQAASSIPSIELAAWLTEGRIAAYYDANGIDLNGIDGQARAVLDYLDRNGSVPAKRLRQALSLTTDADFDAIDEYLIRLGLIRVDSRGRTLTPLGLRYRTHPEPLRSRIDGVRS